MEQVSERVSERVRSGRLECVTYIIYKPTTVELVYGLCLMTMMA